MLPCNKAHSAVKKTKKKTPKNLKVIYSVGASSFPVNKATAEQASRQTSPPFCFFSLQGGDFFSFFFFPRVAPVQNQIFGDKFEFSVFTDLRVSEVSTHPFYLFRSCGTCAAFTARWKRVEKPFFIEMRAYRLPIQTSGNSPRVCKPRARTCKASTTISQRSGMPRETLKP